MCGYGVGDFDHQHTIIIVISHLFFTLYELWNLIPTYPPCLNYPHSSQVTIFMATIRNLLFRTPSSSPNITKLDPIYSLCSSSTLPIIIKPTPFNTNLKTTRKTFTTKAAASVSGVKKVESDERVVQVHSIQEFDDALKAAKNKLVVVEYAASHSYQSKRMFPFMVELSRTCNEVEFLLVMGDESDGTKALCEREKIEKVPHFSFYKSMEKIHDEEGIGPDELMGDVLYYGDKHSSVLQLHSGEDVTKLIAEHKEDHKLLVLDVGLKHCGPCVKVYPTVLKLSRQMTDTVVFARMNGDENDSCMKFLKDMDVIEVPTFLFIRDGEICGRYVGSGRGELIGEILRYQGVRVT